MWNRYCLGLLRTIAPLPMFIPLITLVFLCILYVPVLAQEASSEQVESGPATSSSEPRSQGNQPTNISEIGASGTNGDLIRFTFQWPEEVASAVFRRGSNIWIVFNKNSRIDLNSLRVQGKDIITHIEQLPINAATILKLQVPNERISPTVTKEGLNWVVGFTDQRYSPPQQIRITADVDEDIGPHVIFTTTKPVNAISVPDPDTGDTLWVAAFKESGAGILGRRRYPEFHVLPSAQGVAIVGLSDNVLLERTFEGYTVSATDGLHISAISPDVVVTGDGAFNNRRLFDFIKWRIGEMDEFVENHQKLFRTIGEIPLEKINSARLNLARFLVANTRAAEALGVLRVIATEDPTGSKDSLDFQSLHGVALALMRRVDESRQILDDPRMDGYTEIALWRGYLDALSGRYREANKNFLIAESVLRSYPFPIKGPIAIARLETALANRDMRSANNWVDILERDFASLPREYQGDLRYHQGRIAVAKTDFLNAQLFWRNLINSNDRKNSARALQALVNLNLNTGEITRKEAIEKFRALSYMWRGDIFELVTLHQLGRLYLDEGQYSEGLKTFRTAVSYFPDHPFSEEMAVEMVERFRNLFLDDKADALPPLRAIALYEEFRELTPAGREGDLLIEKLAGRLAKVDLLPNAAAQLELLVSLRVPPGNDRARLGAKLALIYLLDSKPEEALNALARTGQALLDIDPEIAADRRRISARAFFQRNQPVEAIKRVAGDISLEADLLRRDIFWQEKNWQEVGRVLQRLTGDPPDDPEDGMKIDNARYLVNWAVALFHNNDKYGLERLRKNYNLAMASSPLSGIFEYVTNSGKDVEGESLMETVDFLIGKEGFSGFLESYRSRMFEQKGDNEKETELKTSTIAEVPTENKEEESETEN